MLNKSGDSGHPRPVSDFKENIFSFSPLNMMLAVGLSYVTFIMLRCILSIPTLLRVFNHKCVLVFFLSFISASLSMII